MGINFDGVNPESKAKLDKIVSDGKVTAEEVKGLSAAEKEALSKGLGGVELPVEGEIKVKDAPEPQEKGRSLGETIGLGAAVVTGTTVLGGLIGGVVGFFGGGAGAVPGAIAGAKLGALAGAALVGTSMLTSCDKDDFLTSSKVIQNVSGTVIVKNDPDIINYLKQLVELQKAESEKNDARHEEYISYIKQAIQKAIKLNDEIKNIDASMATIISLLASQNVKIDSIIEAISEMQLTQEVQTAILKKLVDNDNIKIDYLEQILAEVRNGNELQQNTQDILDQILEKLDKLDANDQQGAELMNQILAQLTAFAKQQGDMDAKTHDMLQTIINNQDKMSAEMKSGLAAILGKLNKFDANVKAGVMAILAKLDQVDKNAQAGIVNLLAKLDTMDKNTQAGITKILAKLDQMDENTQSGIINVLSKLDQMDENNRANTLDVLAKLDEMDSNIRTSVVEILAKLDKMDKNAQERFTALLPLLGDLGNVAVQILNTIKAGNALTEKQLQTIINKLGSQSDKLDDIRELIMKNNEIAQQTQDAVKDMSANMSAEHKAILEAIKNGTASVDNIQKILVEIKNNTSVLPDMNKKLCVIGTAIEQVLKEVQGMRTETKKGLLAILAKIPDGCHCQPTDISGIIDLLNKLLDAIQKDPEDDKNHEGILTDLNKYFD